MVYECDLLTRPRTKHRHRHYEFHTRRGLEAGLLAPWCGGGPMERPRGAQQHILQLTVGEDSGGAPPRHRSVKLGKKLLLFSEIKMVLKHFLHLLSFRL